MDIFGLVKKYPVASAAVVVVGVVVIFFIVGSAGASDTEEQPRVIALNSAPSDTAVAANAQLRLAEIGVTNTQIQTNAAIRQSEINAGVTNYTTDAQKELGLYNLTTQLRATESTNNAQVSMASIGANAATSQAQYSAQAAMAQAEYQFLANRDTVTANLNLGLDTNQLARLQSNNATLLGVTQSNNGLAASQEAGFTTRYVADAEAGTARYNTDAALQLGTLQSNNALVLGQDTNFTTRYVSDNDQENNILNNQTVVTLSADARFNNEVNNDTARRLGEQQTRQTEITANNARRANRDSGIFGFLGNAAGAIASIFSDERLKEEITLQGQLPNGLNLYSYKFLPTGEYQLGVMAQEVQLHYPDMVSRHAPTGALMVSHGAM